MDHDDGLRFFLYSFPQFRKNDLTKCSSPSSSLTLYSTEKRNNERAGSDNAFAVKVRNYRKQLSIYSLL